MPALNSIFTELYPNPKLPKVKFDACVRGAAAGLIVVTAEVADPPPFAQVTFKRYFIVVPVKFGGV